MCEIRFQAGIILWYDEGMWSYTFFTYICLGILGTVPFIMGAHANPEQPPMPEVAPNSMQVIRNQAGKVQSITVRTEDYLEIMRQQNRLPEAQKLLLRLMHASNTPNTKGQMAYYLGMITFELGDYAQAEQYYRISLENIPNDVWVQLELAMTLFILQKYEASQYYFEQVKNHTANAEILQTVHAYLQKIASKRTFDYTFQMGLYPNNNVNNAPQVENYQFFGKTVTPTERPKSAVGITYDMSVYYKKRGRNNDIYTLSLAPSGTKYQQSKYDNTIITLALSRLDQLQKGYTNAKIHIGRSWSGGHKDRKIWGVSYTHGWYVGQKTVLSLTGDWGHTNLISGNYNVIKTAIVPSVQYHITPVSSIHISINQIRTNHDLSNRTGTQNGGIFGYNRTLQNGIKISPSLSFNRFVSDKVQSGLGGIRIRETTEVNLGIKLSPYAIFNFVPTVQLGMSRVDSTIKMDRAKNTAFNIIFKRTF